jgi:hypothetical protein
MSVTIKKVGKRGADKGTIVSEYEDYIDKYKIKSGQVYLSADGANYGVVVKDTETHRKRNAVSVTPIGPLGVSGPDQVLDAKIMSQVEYYLVEPPYITWTKDVMSKFGVKKKRKSTPSGK